MARVLRFQCLDSTNNELKRLAQTEDIRDCVVIAEAQTGGRGRGGNSFLSKEGGLYMSAVLCPDTTPDSVSDITAWVAVAVRRALCEILPEGVSPEIKWINDIVLNKRKLAGILCELIIEHGRVKYIIAGIGINVRNRDFPPELSEKATSLYKETGIDYSIGELAQYVIASLGAMEADYPEKKKEYLTEYSEHCVTLGKKVCVLSADGARIKAVALGVDANFHLKVKTEDGDIKILDSGDVSVRGLYGYTD